MIRGHQQVFGRQTGADGIAANADRGDEFRERMVGQVQMPESDPHHIPVPCEAVHLDRDLIAGPQCLDRDIAERGPNAGAASEADQEDVGAAESVRLEAGKAGGGRRQRELAEVGTGAAGAAPYRYGGADRSHRRGPDRTRRDRSEINDVGDREAGAHGHAGDGGVGRERRCRGPVRQKNGAGIADAVQERDDVPRPDRAVQLHIGAGIDVQRDPGSHPAGQDDGTARRGDGGAAATRHDGAENAAEPGHAPGRDAVAQHNAGWRC